MTRSPCYLVTAYRWGASNGARYVLGCWSDEQEARQAAEREHQHRGGKYALAVDRWEGGLPDLRDEAPCWYLPSQTEAQDATRPVHVARLEHIAHLGATVLTAWERETGHEDIAGHWPAWLAEHLQAIDSPAQYRHHLPDPKLDIATSWALELQETCEVLAPAVGDLGGACDTASGFARRAAAKIAELQLQADLLNADLEAHADELADQSRLAERRAAALQLAALGGAQLERARICRLLRGIADDSTEPQGAGARLVRLLEDLIERLEYDHEPQETP